MQRRFETELVSSSFVTITRPAVQVSTSIAADAQMLSCEQPVSRSVTNCGQ